MVKWEKARKKKISINNEVTFIVWLLNRSWRFPPNATQILSHKELLKWAHGLGLPNSVSRPVSWPLCHCDISMTQPAGQASPTHVSSLGEQGSSRNSPPHCWEHSYLEWAPLCEEKQNHILANSTTVWREQEWLLRAPGPKYLRSRVLNSGLDSNPNSLLFQG